MNNLRTYKDKRLIHIHSLMNVVLTESDRQLSKWGTQNVTSFEWMTYLTEEVGELAQAINEFEYRQGCVADIVKEAIQVATLSLKIAEFFKFNRIDERDKIV